MRWIFPFVLFLFWTETIGQILANLEPKKISKTSDNAFLLAKNPSKKMQVVHRIGATYAIIKNDGFDNISKTVEVYEINNNWKWATENMDKKNSLFYVRTSKSLADLGHFSEISFDPANHLSVIKAKKQKIDKHLLPLSHVTYIQLADRIATEESILREHNLGINGIRKVHQSQEHLDGAGLAVSVKENAFDANDIDFLGRGQTDIQSSTFITSHATDMATLIAGAGNSGKAGTGVAKKAQLYSESFENLMPAGNSQFGDRGITVQNHSYGVGIENFYGVESEAFDQQAIDKPELLHVFSSGNAGTENSTGEYSSIIQYRTLTGSFKQAKNVLVVNGTDDNGSIPDSHSAGPAFDGRIKPELSAYGGGGTSQAAALVTGAAMMIQQTYFEKHAELPTGDMQKAILIAASDDIELPGPDFKSGYGQLNLAGAVHLVNQDWIYTGTIDSNSEETITLHIPENTSAVKVVLAWRDPPANDSDFMALVNDLNLKIEKEAEEWLPWVLDHRADENLLGLQASRKIDTLNNVEMVTIQNPEAGDYSIIVSAGLLTGNQDFSIAYYMEARNGFSWNYPNSIDPQLVDEAINCYFKHSFDQLGTLAIDYLEDNWTDLGNISPGDRSFAFPPTRAGEAVLRATFDGLEIKSDTFAIHAKPEMEVALLCDDKLVINWDQQETKSFEVSFFDENLPGLSPVQTTTDTFSIIDRTVYQGQFFTVRPIFEFTNGRADETVKVNQQGAGCYLNNFLVSLEEDGGISAKVSLSLPSQIESLKIFKTDREDSITWVNLNPVQTNYEFVDNDLIPGRTAYQTMITTFDGLEILSASVEVFTTDDKKYILFPNPVSGGQLALLSPVTNAVFQVLDRAGRPITDYVISAEFEVFPVSLSKGIYFYRVIKEDQVVKSGRFAVGD